MTRRKASTATLFAKRVAASRSNTDDAAATPYARNPADLVLRGKYRALTHQHLSALFDRLLAAFTGLHFHIAWAPPTWHDSDARIPPTACSVCCRLAGKNPGTQSVCRICGPRQLVRGLRAGSKGLYFKCHLGVMNYWLPIRIRGVTVGIAYLQALGRGQHTRAIRRAIQAPGRAGFLQARRLFRLIIQHVQTLGLTDLLNEDLSKTRRTLRVVQLAHTRLRQKLKGVIPALSTSPVVAQPMSHPERIVYAVLDRIYQNAAQRLTLQQCASDLQLNAAYLSHLFSKVVGLPFKTCLTEVRIEKGMQLLSDPARSISQVARAVGYASENRFRLAFKNVTGVSPKVWRDTLQMSLPPESA